MDVTQKPENRVVNIARVKQNGMKTMSNTKTITVRKDLVYNVDLIKKNMAEAASCLPEDIPFEDVLEFTRMLALLDMSDNPSSQYLIWFGENGEDLEYGNHA
jgi:hypothetical protein